MTTANLAKWFLGEQETRYGIRPRNYTLLDKDGRPAFAPPSEKNFFPIGCAGSRQNKCPMFSCIFPGFGRFFELVFCRFCRSRGLDPGVVRRNCVLRSPAHQEGRMVTNFRIPSSPTCRSVGHRCHRWVVEKLKRMWGAKFAIPGAWGMMTVVPGA